MTIVTIGIITTIGISQDAYALLDLVILDGEDSCHDIFGDRSVWNVSHNKCIMHGSNTISSNTLLEISDGVKLVIRYGEELVNEERIKNRGLITNMGKIINDRGQLINYGHIHNNERGNITSYNSGAIVNYQTVNNKIGGTIKNYGVTSGIHNALDFKNYGDIINVNSGIITNYDGGIIDNYNGTIDNYLGGIITNYYGGTINNYNDGIIKNRFGGTIDNNHSGIITNINGSIIYNHEINCLTPAVIHGNITGNQPVPTNCDIP